MIDIPDRWKRVTLGQAREAFRSGTWTPEEFDGYCHVWQTSAPRIAVRACQCGECRERFQSPEYTT